MPKSTFTEQYRQLRAALVAARSEAGMTQRDVAARLAKNPSYVARVETGERRLDVVEFFEFARAIEADPYDLLRKVPTL